MRLILQPDKKICDQSCNLTEWYGTQSATEKYMRPNWDLSKIWDQKCNNERYKTKLRHKQKNETKSALWPIYIYIHLCPKMVHLGFNFSSPILLFVSLWVKYTFSFINIIHLLRRRRNSSTTWRIELNMLATVKKRDSKHTCHSSY